MERTISHLARELAGQFYEFVRAREDSGERVQIEQRGRILLRVDPKAFAKTYPTVKDYLAGRRHGRMRRTPDGCVFHVEDGAARLDTPGWLFWYDMARQMLVATLANEGTHEHIKQGIAAALIEDREKQLKQQAAGIKSPQISQRAFITR